jgi:HlyD family secretion protein
MKRWISILSAALLLSVLIGWRLTQKQAKAAAEKQAGAAMRSAPALVETVPVTRQDIVKAFEAVGSVEAPFAVDISSEVAGRIVYLLAREGDRVQAGQILVRIDPADLTSEMHRRRAALEAARARLSEATLTKDAQRVSVSSEVRQRKTALNTARALERKAKADYDVQIASADANVTAAEGRVKAAEADIAGADAGIASAQANVDNARTFLERQEALLTKGFVAKQLVDNARTGLKVQEAALNRAKEFQKAAVAARDSARAEKQAAEKQAQVTRNQADADVAAATSAVAQAQAMLETAQANIAQTPAYAQNLAALQATVAAAEADLRSAQNRLGDTTIRSPLNGVITRRMVDPGAIVPLNQPILSVQAVQQVWATVSVPEEISRFLFTEQPATVAFDALPRETFTGKIAQILPAADVQSRQFTVRVRLDNRANRIRPGMFGRVRFVTQQARNATVVPLEAIKPDPAKPGVGSVTVIVDGKAQTRQVETGLDNGKQMVVKKGLAEGDQVIILSAGQVKEGQKVRTGTKEGENKEGEREKAKGESPTPDTRRPTPATGSAR